MNVISVQFQPNVKLVDLVLIRKFIGGMRQNFFFFQNLHVKYMITFSLQMSQFKNIQYEIS